MQVVLPYIYLIVGFVVLIKGADFFVDGSCSIAKKLRIPDIVVGLTVVALGTSLPELAVSLSAAAGGSSDMALGNVVGSNLINILVILGLSAAILPLTVDKSMFRRDLPVLMLTAVVLPVMTLVGGYRLGRICGAILTALFVGYIILTVRSALAYRNSECALPEGGEEALKEESGKVLPWWLSILFTVGGAAMIVFGGNFSVDGATEIAHQLGVSEAVIGLTVVALGTSLPELVTSAVAARKGNSDIALGNVVGSCIFNVLFILGTTALVRPLTVARASLVDQLVLLGVTVYLFVATYASKRLSRPVGISFLLIYGGYLTYLLLQI
jgi:cation:H+ antiporter